MSRKNAAMTHPPTKRRETCFPMVFYLETEARSRWYESKNFTEKMFFAKLQVIFETEQSQISCLISCLVVLSNIFLFLPLFGEDSHFD